jgi:hypothetical protein
MKRGKRREEKRKKEKKGKRFIEWEFSAFVTQKLFKKRINIS